MAEIKNLKTAAQRIRKAVETKEKIILFADADLDGVSSLIIMEEAIKSLGGEVFLVYFPDREIEGYGLNRQALDYLRKDAPALLVLFDCGIGNVDELGIAQNFDFEPVVIDHHEVLDELPVSVLVVDPKQPGDDYPFKRLATVSIVYCLAEELLGEKRQPLFKRSAMELAALGVIADMMPEEDVNKMVVGDGLLYLTSTFRPGLKEIANLLREQNDSLRAIVQKIVAVLNITQIKNHLAEAYTLLSTSSSDEARELAKRLQKESKVRQEKIKEMYEEIVKRTKDQRDAVIFEGDNRWSQALTGAVASRVCNKLQKPTFVFKIGLEKSRGSVRVTSQFNAVLALRDCHKFLEVYGGHPQAAGFTLANENLDNFRQCLERYFEKKE